MKTEVKFEIGDVVMLKSGGPSMTVSAIQEDIVRCAWFKDDEVRSVQFQRAMLEVRSRNR